jgi:hypothetical protein
VLTTEPSSKKKKQQRRNERALIENIPGTECYVWTCSGLTLRAWRAAECVMNGATKTALPDRMSAGSQVNVGRESASAGAKGAMA